MDRYTSVRVFVAVAASALLMSEIAAAQQIQSLGGLSQRQGQSLGGLPKVQSQSLGRPNQGLTQGQSQGPGGQVQLQVQGLCQIQTQSQGQTTTFAETDLVANKSPLRDSNGVVHTAKRTDPNLLNPWGLTASSTSPFWAADNGAGVATLYPVQETTVGTNNRVVSIPSPTNLFGGGTPTGTVFNIAPASPAAFQISGFNSNKIKTTKPSNFIFATEDGTIVGWSNGAPPNNDVNPPGFNPANAGNYGIIAVDNSNNPIAGNGAVYKGLAIATDATGKTLLYATNFRAGTVEVYDINFKRVTSPPGAFTDLNLPSGYAPFNIVPVGNRLVVTYAVQDAAKHDDVAGIGNGIVNSFDFSGGSLQRLIQFGCLNSPWGVALAPSNFGPLAGSLLIGNFGDGRVGAYNSTNGQLIDLMRDHQGNILAIDGLWSLRVGSGATGTNNNFGPDTVYFTAGPNDEQDGLFGALKPN